MMNLKDLGQKLYSKIGLILGGILVIFLLYKGTILIIDYFKNKKIQEQYELIDQYKTSVDSIQNVNAKLTLKINTLEKEVDSLQGVKEQIQWKYGKEIITIYDGSIIDHAKWLESVITELDTTKRLY